MVGPPQDSVFKATEAVNFTVRHTPWCMSRILNTRPRVAVLHTVLSIAAYWLLPLYRVLAKTHQPRGLAVDPWIRRCGWRHTCLALPCAWWRSGVRCSVCSDRLPTCKICVAAGYKIGWRKDREDIVLCKEHVVPPPSQLHIVVPILVLLMVESFALTMLMLQQDRGPSLAGLNCFVHTHTQGRNTVVGCVLCAPLATESADGMRVCVWIFLLCYLSSPTTL